MNTKLACCLIALLGVLAQKPEAQATFHLMQIEQVIGGVNGDATAQAIQLRMRAGAQNFVSGGKLIVVDAAGLNPITILDVTTNVTNGAVGSHVLIASANFPSHTTPATVPDFTMANVIPASYLAAGSLMWQSDTGTIYWRLSGAALPTPVPMPATPPTMWTAISAHHSAAPFLRAASPRCSSREPPLPRAPTTPPTTLLPQARQCLLTMPELALPSTVRRCRPFR